LPKYTGGKTFLDINWCIYVQPIADKVAQNLDIISKKFQFSTRHTRILMRFVISTIY